jgi:FkbM family methyltransferase
VLAAASTIDDRPAQSSRIAAVSDHSGTVRLSRALAYDNYNSQVGDDGSGFAVRAVRLDDELPISGHRIALKIDIEGHEPAALEGMKGLLRRNDCFLQVECWPENAAAFIAAMKAEGYNLLHQISVDHYFAREA